VIAASAKRRYIAAFDLRPDRYPYIPMGNFISGGAPGCGKTEETFSSPEGVSRDSLENSLRLMEETIAGAWK
jgi:hypothetical protein